MATESGDKLVGENVKQRDVIVHPLISRNFFKYLKHWLKMMLD